MWNKSLKALHTNKERRNILSIHADKQIFQGKMRKKTQGLAVGLLHKKPQCQLNFDQSCSRCRKMWLKYVLKKWNNMKCILYCGHWNWTTCNCISHKVCAIEQSKQELIFVNELKKQISNSVCNFHYLFPTLNWSDAIFRNRTYIIAIAGGAKRT